MTHTPDGDHVIAIGASAGGIEALQALLAELPSAIQATIVIAIHSAPGSTMPDLLQRLTRVPVKKAKQGERLEKGTIYVVPGATHAFFQNGSLRLSERECEANFRPSIDALFMTLAAEYRERAIAVVLSGTMDDGMRGAEVICDMGGRTLVQSPEDARFDSMPLNVIITDHPRQILPAPELGRWIAQKFGKTAPA